jgi:hypothetical protein
MSTRYLVKIEDFAERHFIERFKKEYKDAWEITWRGILEELERIDSLFLTSIAETIVNSDRYQIIKIEFRIAGCDASRKSSGNRCIVAIDKEKDQINILLVYNNHDLDNKLGEVAEFSKIIKENYKEYSHLF